MTSYTPVYRPAPQRHSNRSGYRTAIEGPDDRRGFHHHALAPIRDSGAASQLPWRGCDYFGTATLAAGGGEPLPGRGDQAAGDAAVGVRKRSCHGGRSAAAAGRPLLGEGDGTRSVRLIASDGDA